MSSSMGYRPFPLTHWSLVRRAGGGLAGDDEARREALEVLLSRYQPALRSYLLMAWRIPAERADEIVQGFIVDRMLGDKLLQGASQFKGRFRQLLMTALHNYAVSWARKDRLRRGEPISQEVVHSAGVTAVTAGAIVEAAWARALVHDVLCAMREQCAETGRADVWIVFEARVVAEAFGTADRSGVVSYEQLAARLGLQSPTQAANLLVTGKRMFARVLRAAVAEYEMDDADVDAEIADLRRVLAAAST